MKCRGFFLFSSTIILLPSLVAGQKYKILPSLVTQRLSGPVHSMEVMEAEGDQPPTSDRLQALNIYDRDGFLTEDYSYDPETGALEMHRVFTRGADKKIMHVVTQMGDETRIADIHEEHGVTIKEQREGNGKLISRSEETPDKQVLRFAEDGDAIRSTTALTTTHDEDKAAGETIDTVQRNDKVLDQTITKRTATGSIKVSREPDGSFSETTEDAHGGHLHTYNASEHMNVYLTFEDGYTVEAIYDKPDSYSRSTFTYDKDLGLPSTETQFNRSGKVVGRVRYEYDHDAYGNWTERRKFVTQAADPNGSWKRAGTTRRIITYY